MHLLRDRRVLYVYFFLKVDSHCYQQHFAPIDVTAIVIISLHEDTELSLKSGYFL